MLRRRQEGKEEMGIKRNQIKFGLATRKTSNMAIGNSKIRRKKNRGNSEILEMSILTIIIVICCGSSSLSCMHYCHR